MVRGTKGGQLMVVGLFMSWPARDGRSGAVGAPDRGAAAVPAAGPGRADGFQIIKLLVADITGSPDGHLNHAPFECAPWGLVGRFRGILEVVRLGGRDGALFWR